MAADYASSGDSQLAAFAIEWATEAGHAEDSRQADESGRPNVPADLGEYFTERVIAARGRENVPAFLLQEIGAGRMAPVDATALWQEGLERECAGSLPSALGDYTDNHLAAWTRLDAAAVRWGLRQIAGLPMALEDILGIYSRVRESAPAIAAVVVDVVRSEAVVDFDYAELVHMLDSDDPARRAFASDAMRPSLDGAGSLLAFAALDHIRSEDESVRRHSVDVLLHLAVLGEGGYLLPALRPLLESGDVALPDRFSYASILLRTGDCGALAQVEQFVNRQGVRFRPEFCRELITEGQEGDLPLLRLLLDMQSSLEVAGDYVNSGNPALASMADDWARALGLSSELGRQPERRDRPRWGGAAK